MRLLSLILVAGIIFYAYGKRAEPKKDSVDSAMVEYEKTAPPTPPAASHASVAASAPTAPATSNIRRPIDRTRSVLEQVKKQVGENDL